MAIQEVTFRSGEDLYVPMHPITRGFFAAINKVIDAIYALRGELRPPVRLY